MLLLSTDSARANAERTEAAATARMQSTGLGALRDATAASVSSTIASAAAAHPPSLSSPNLLRSALGFDYGRAKYFTDEARQPAPQGQPAPRNVRAPAAKLAFIETRLSRRSVEPRGLLAEALLDLGLLAQVRGCHADAPCMGAVRDCNLERPPACVHQCGRACACVRMLCARTL